MGKHKWDWKKRPHLTMIGMPTAGKTKIGSLLAASLSRPFIDIDDCIVEKARASCLQEVVDSLPQNEFAQLEEDAAIETLRHLSTPSIIATGGSMIYHQKAMQEFARRTFVVHLKATYETIQGRVAKHPNRGILFAPGETLKGLYTRRMPLYEQWADRTVNVDHDRTALAAELAKDFALQEFN